MSDKVEKHLKFWLKIQMGLLVFIFYNMLQLFSVIMWKTLEVYLDYSMSLFTVTIPYVILLVILGLVTILILKSTYIYRNRLLLMHLIFSFIILLNFIAFIIMQDALSVFDGMYTSYKIDTLFLVYTLTHKFLFVVISIGVIATILYSCISLYIILGIAEETRSYRLFTKAETIKISVLFFIIVVGMGIALNVKHEYLKQQVTVEIESKDRIEINVCGMNGYGYLCGEDGYALEYMYDKFRVANEISQYDSNPKLAYFRKFLLAYRTRYKIKDNRNGTYKNGDVAEIEIGLPQKYQNVRLSGATTYKIEVTGLPDVKVQTYDELSLNQKQRIDEKVQKYMKELVESSNIWLNTSKKMQSIDSSKPITLVAKGYKNPLTNFNKELFQYFDSETDFTEFDTSYQRNYNQSVVYQFKLFGSKEDQMYAEDTEYIVEIYYDLNPNIWQSNQLLESVLYYVAYEENEQNKQSMKHLNEDVVWIEGGQ